MAQSSYGITKIQVGIVPYTLPLTDDEILVEEDSPLSLEDIGLKYTKDSGYVEEVLYVASSEHFPSEQSYMKRIFLDISEAFPDIFKNLTDVTVKVPYTRDNKVLRSNPYSNWGVSVIGFLRGILNTTGEKAAYVILFGHDFLSDSINSVVANKSLKVNAFCGISFNEEPPEEKSLEIELQLPLFANKFHEEADILNAIENGIRQLVGKALSSMTTKLPSEWRISKNLKTNSEGTIVHIFEIELKDYPNVTSIVCILEDEFSKLIAFFYSQRMPKM